MITSYVDLLSKIRGLPPPADGRLRVYRGQTTEYSKILSSFGRVREADPSGILSAHFHHWFIKEATLGILGELKNLPRYDFFDLKITPEDFYLAEALVQHYGYQTSYIDVTLSLDTALWFSTHRFCSRTDDPVGDKPPFRLTLPAWYEGPSEEGVLYVMDVNRWNQKSAISKGDYINLVEISSEGVNRPRRQNAGVLFAPGLPPENDDVSRFVTAKFTIAFSWAETGKELDTNYLFPTPAEDPIYSRLLQSPFLRTVRQQPNAAEEVVWSRSCTLPEYYAHPGDATSQKLYRSFDKALEPTLYYPWVMRNLNDLQANPMWQSTLRVGFEHVTPILLERPLILFSVQRGGPHPPPERPFENIPPPFRNFLLEYSPEQFTFGYDESRMSRAVWCCWLGPDHFILQSFGTLNGKPRASEFSEYNWEPSKGLVRTAGLELSGSYLTFPLNLIRLTIAGALTLRPPVPPNHYHTLTTNEKFWTEVSSWTDLL